MARFVVVLIFMCVFDANVRAEEPKPVQAKPAPSSASTDLTEASEKARAERTLDAEAARKTFDQLGEDLSAADQHKRLAAIRALRLHFTPETKDKTEKRLLDLAQDVSWIVRGEALFSLGFGEADPPVVALLRQSLKDDHWFVRARSIQSLGRLKVRAAAHELVALHAGETWDNQARIIHALGEIGDSRAVDTVLAALASSDESLRLTAIQALKHFKTGPAVQAVLDQTAREQSETAKLHLARAVGLLGIADAKANIVAWRGLSPALDREITLACYRLGDAEAAETLVREYPHFSPAVQLDVMREWRGKGEARAVPLLLNVLVEGAPEHRRAAAAALEAVGEKLPAAPVVVALTDIDPATRETLVRILKKSRDPELPKLLVKRLKDEPPRAEREAIVGLLENHNTSETVDGLLAVRLNDKGKPRLGVALALEKFNVTIETLSAKAADTTLPMEERVRAVKRLGLLGDPTATTKLAQLAAASEDKPRLAAVEALGRTEDRAAIEPLIARLDDADPNVRRAARDGLVAFGITPDRLVADLKSPNRQLRLEALHLLGLLGDSRQGGAVAELLRDPEPVTRRTAAQVLGAFKDARAVDPLLNLLRDTDLSVRTAAAGALGRIGDGRAAAGLLTALRANSDAGVGAEIAAALVKLRSTQAVPVLIDSLRSPNWTARAQVARILGEFRDPRAVPPLTAALEDQSAVVRYYARQSLVRIGGASPDELIRLFAKRESRARFGVTEVVREANLTGTLDRFIELLRDERIGIRSMAAYAVGTLRDARAVEKLVERVEIEDRFAVRWWLAHALGQIGDPAREAVLKLAKNKNPRVKSDALRALGFMPPAEASRTVLLAALDDKDDQVRASALEALGRSGDEAVTSALVALLQPNSNSRDANRLIRADSVIAALLSMDEVGKKALADFVPRADAGLKAVILHALGEDGDPRLLPVLTGAARDAEPRVRIAALRELARQSDEKAFALIVGALNDGSEEVRAETVKLLELLGDAQGVEAMKAQLKREPSPRVRSAIEQALQRRASLAGKP